MAAPKPLFPAVRSARTAPVPRAWHCAGAGGKGGQRPCPRRDPRPLPYATGTDSSDAHGPPGRPEVS